MNEAPRIFAAGGATYIVRIYRVGGDRRHRIVGIVETVGDDLKTAFSSLDELWSILTRRVDDAGLIERRHD